MAALASPPLSRLLCFSLCDLFFFFLSCGPRARGAARRAALRGPTAGRAAAVLRGAANPPRAPAAPGPARRRGLRAHLLVLFGLLLGPFLLQAALIREADAREHRAAGAARRRQARARARCAAARRRAAPRRAGAAAACGAATALGAPLPPIPRGGGAKSVADGRRTGARRRSRGLWGRAGTECEVLSIAKPNGNGRPCRRRPSSRYSPPAPAGCTARRAAGGPRGRGAGRKTTGAHPSAHPSPPRAATRTPQA
jgi:hypothetical protein